MKTFNLFLIIIIGFVIMSGSIVIGIINDDLMLGILGTLGGFGLSSFAINRIRINEFEAIE